MSTKKPTAKQLEARKRFAEMAKKRASATKKKKPLTKAQSLVESALIESYNDVNKAYESLNQSLAKYETSPKGTNEAIRKRMIDLGKAINILENRILKERKGLKKPVTKGLTTLCAKTVGVDGRRKKDGTVKKNHVVKKGGKVVAVKKKTTVKKGLKGVAKTDKYLVKFWKDKDVIKETKTKTKAEAEKLKRSYLSSFHITKRVAEKRQATISKL